MIESSNDDRAFVVSPPKENIWRGTQSDLQTSYVRSTVLPTAVGRLTALLSHTSLTLSRKAFKVILDLDLSFLFWLPCFRGHLFNEPGTHQ
jgi:hypothetical protein